MTAEEKLRCIKYINPKAHCVVWEGGIVKYDQAHIGAKPSTKECETVLPIIQKQIEKEKEKHINEEKIRVKMRDLAIESLKVNGDIPTDYR